ncbi:hypothetical protein Vadar_006397 [Vaccinium darrowii]|uniref:Uncharacterized protein n=1 Tax=Vaccinium darrowii TaxID=229202 RepID=A0ACB7WYD7_9ERIC|nr:hypothetical protein Vadar_006397 [Vaccinium darrowii]
MALVRALTNAVARWLIVTSNKPPPTVALNPSASKSNRIPPDHLSVVPTPPTKARILVVVVIGLLSDSQAHRSSPSEVSASNGDILAIISSTSRMHERAITGMYIGVVLCKCCHVGVPRHGAHTNGGSGGVVGSFGLGRNGELLRG